MNPLLHSTYSRFMVGDATTVAAASATPPASPFTVFVFGMGVGALFGLFTMKVAGLL